MQLLVIKTTEYLIRMLDKMSSILPYNTVTMYLKLNSISE